MIPYWDTKLGHDSNGEVGGQSQDVPHICLGPVFASAASAFGGRGRGLRVRLVGPEGAQLCELRQGLELQGKAHGLAKLTATKATEVTKVPEATTNQAPDVC